jgi:hypothetical protein
MTEGLTLSSARERLERAARALAPKHTGGLRAGWFAAGRAGKIARAGSCSRTRSE